MSSSPEQHLRLELNRVREENQRLRERIATEKSPAMMRIDFAHARRRARGIIARMRENVLGRNGTVSPPLPAPHEVRLRHTPLAATRPKVLHLIDNFYIGGSSRLVVDLIEFLGHRYEQCVVSWDLPPAPAFSGIDLVQTKPEDSSRTMRWLRARRIDLVHVHFVNAYNSEYSLESWRWYHGWMEGAKHAGIPIIENLNIPREPYRSDAIRCYVHVSDYVKTRFAPLGADNRTIYPGSDFSMFQPKDAEREENMIGMVYRLEGDKLDERSIEPFIWVVRMRPATRVLIVGGGRFLDHFQRRVQNERMQDAFIFTGYVPYESLPEQIARMSVFVAPVHTESFGQVSPFAMGMGVPVAGYNVGALAEIIGTETLLAPPGDVEKLAEIVVNLLDAPARRQAIGAFNRERALRLFSVETMTSEYDRLYSEILSAGTTGSTA